LRVRHFALRALPEPFTVILGGVGDGVDSFRAGFLPRQLWQYLLHRFDRRLMCLLIAATRFAYLAVSQAGAAPRWRALFSRDWWTFHGHVDNGAPIHTGQKAETMTPRRRIYSHPGR